MPAKTVRGTKVQYGSSHRVPLVELSLRKAYGAKKRLKPLATQSQCLTTISCIILDWAGLNLRKMRHAVSYVFLRWQNFGWLHQISLQGFLKSWQPCIWKACKWNSYLCSHMANIQWTRGNLWLPLGTEQDRTRHMVDINRIIYS